MEIGEFGLDEERHGDGASEAGGGVDLEKAGPDEERHNDSEVPIDRVPSGKAVLRMIFL